MNFVTLEFALFFLAVLAGGALLQERREASRVFLLVSSLFFYAWAGPSFLPLLFLVAAADWATAKRLHALAKAPLRSRRLVLGLDIAFHILLLVVFKYAEFLFSSLDALSVLLFPGAGLARHFQLPEILYPVGLSFFSFQGLSYAVDQYREPGRRPYAFSSVLLFVSFFPCVLSGPILRTEQFFPQLRNRDFSSRSLQEGFALILSGLFKKVVLASYLSEHVVRDVFTAPEFHSSWAVITAVYAYAIQIFCDFSGYTDLAMGTGRLMGFRLPQNFNAPYLALSLRDFWHRWHITLSLWLRDYLYFPLGGSRRGSRSLNLIITMLLGGLWHGSHLRFLLWGLLHGLGLAVSHIFMRWRMKMLAGKEVSPALARAGRFFSWLLTFHCVVLLWIFFRAEDMERCLEIFRRMATPSLPGQGIELLALPAIALGFGIQIAGPRLFQGFLSLQERCAWPVQALILALLASLCLAMGPDGVMPFIYFQF